MAIYVLHYKRYRVPRQSKYNTVHGAIAQAASMIDEGWAWPGRIEDESGAVVLTEEQVYEKANQLLDELDKL